MAWTPPSQSEPNLDIGPEEAVPTSLTSVCAVKAWLLGAHFTNDTSGFITVTVKNTAGKILCKVKIPPNAEQPYSWAFRPTLGIEWIADNTGLFGHIWGRT